MKHLFQSLATPSKYVVFHCVAFAIIATGVVMLMTVGELGPVAVFIVPLGIYTVILGLFCEVLFALRFLIAVLIKKLQSHQCERPIIMDSAK